MRLFFQAKTKMHQGKTARGLNGSYCKHEFQGTAAVFGRTPWNYVTLRFLAHIRRKEYGKLPGFSFFTFPFSLGFPMDVEEDGRESGFLSGKNDTPGRVFSCFCAAFKIFLPLYKRMREKQNF